MHFKIIFKIFGLLLMLFSISMIPPIMVAYIYDESSIYVFVTTFVIFLTLGTLVWAPLSSHRDELKIRDGILIVCMFWIVLGLLGAIPFHFVAEANLRYVDSIFESFSGLTTTGATIMINLDTMPKAILFYRQQLQWLGGMGIIVLAVAILPILGIGGMQLYKAESPGPIKDNKLAPRISETARALWFIYLTITIFCTLGYKYVGMDWFDAISHSFSTVAIGGFSTHDTSIAFFNSQAVESVSIFFMLISGINFTLHYVLLTNMRVKHYFKDTEFRIYFLVIFVGFVVVFYNMLFSNFSEHGNQSLSDSFRHSLFQAVSFATTTGFSSVDTSTLPFFSLFFLVLLSFIGACAGSTGGGIKVIRFILLVKQGTRELRRILHPNSVFLIKIGTKKISEHVLSSVWGFFVLYIMFFILLLLLLLITGLDLETSLGALIACINNLGPGFGKVIINYSELSDLVKLILTFSMLLGRLEIFTLVILITKYFWDH